MRRFRWLSLTLTTLLLLCAAWRAMTPLAALVDPVWSTARLTCTPTCRVTTQPVRLLDRELQETGVRRLDIGQRIAERLRDPVAHGSAILARFITAIPETWFFLALALAARDFAQAGVRRASLRHLRTAGWLALAWPLAGAVAHAANSYATTPALGGPAEIHIGIYPQDLLLGLVTAAVIFLVAEALDDALRVRADLDEIV